ncbi:riboflavin synthase [Salinactinospora qingdaonensis]|uniref:Riboflavin synthase n=1 Tax=Salinactinospora qingdaonensis TaxID=702744 RepID=A0ABP7FLC9_9ACTN
MFTGIVEELGEVTAITPVGDSPGEAARITIHAPTVTSDLAHGDSVAVEGVCVTVTDISGASFSADVMKETLDRSHLGALQPGTPVNLERAAHVSARIGGHIVQGHVDGIGHIIERTPGTEWESVRIALPAHLSRYVVEKGSIAVDGISLTVAALDADSFTVGLIPTTLDRTTLGRKEPGAALNLEVDVLAKYVERLIGDRSQVAS